MSSQKEDDVDNQVSWPLDITKLKICDDSFTSIDKVLPKPRQQSHPPLSQAIEYCESRRAVYEAFLKECMQKCSDMAYAAAPEASAKERKKLTYDAMEEQMPQWTPTLEKFLTELPETDGTFKGIGEEYINIGIPRDTFGYIFFITFCSVYTSFDTTENIDRTDQWVALYVRRFNYVISISVHNDEFFIDEEDVSSK